MTDKPTITQAGELARSICDCCHRDKWLRDVARIEAYRESSVAELQAEVERLRVTLWIIAAAASRSRDTFKEKLGHRSYPTWFAVNELQMVVDSIVGIANDALAKKEPVE